MQKEVEIDKKAIRCSDHVIIISWEFADNGLYKRYS